MKDDLSKNVVNTVMTADKGEWLRTCCADPRCRDGREMIAAILKRLLLFQCSFICKCSLCVDLLNWLNNVKIFLADEQVDVQLCDGGAGLGE